MEQSLVLIGPKGADVVPSVEEGELNYQQTWLKWRLSTGRGSHGERRGVRDNLDSPAVNNMDLSTWKSNRRERGATRPNKSDEINSRQNENQTGEPQKMEK